MVVTEEIKKIQKLLDEWKFKKALTSVQQLEERNDLSNNVQIRILLLKSYALLKLGEFNDSMVIVTKILKKKDINPLLTVDALIIKADILSIQGRYEKGLEVVEEGEKKVISIEQEKKAEISKRNSSLLRRKGLIYLATGDLNSALDFIQQCLVLAKEIKDKNLISLALDNIGMVYSFKGDLDKALAYFSQSLTIFREIGNKIGIATGLLHIGAVIRHKGDLDKALAYFSQSLTTYREVGYKRGIALGLLIIGEVYSDKGDFELAKENLTSSLALYEEVGNNINVSQTLFDLTLLLIDNNSPDQAKRYLTRLHMIHQRDDNPIISQWYRLAKSLLLKKGTRITDKVKAQEILEQMVNEEIIWFSITVRAMLDLCELLIDEFKLYGEGEVLQQVSVLLERIHDIAHKQHATPLIAQSLLLQAKFSLVEGNAQRADQLLEQARLITIESGLEILCTKVSEEQRQLRIELDKWNALIQRNAPLRERLELAKLTDYIGEALKVAKSSSSITEKE